MLAELRVRDLGVIAELALVLGPGMTALTGETGTGKTLVVEAIELLLGGRADPVLVRPGATEASVEGRFVGTAGTEDEVVVARTVPASGRPRAYVNGRMAPLSALADDVGALVDLHGQHSHQSLLAASVQRDSLDRFAGVDHGPTLSARRRLRELNDALARLGGDTRSRARELDVLRYQVTELVAAKITDAGEDEQLEQEEERLASATAHREAATAAGEALAGDGGVTDGMAMVLATLAGRPPLAGLYQRLRTVAVDLDDVASELRSVADALEDDPERLEQVRTRRQLLRELRRKYGDTLAEVMAFAEQANTRLLELDSYEEQTAALEQQRADVEADLARAEAAVGGLRRVAAPRLSGAV
ncbi:MAG: DNA repair protein RecN, partial [Actinomycetota bacterium]|nr:DNA repair protein RecN [Actinomycetota bacterium]